MNYKAIFFDLDDTLLDYTTSETKAMMLTVEDHRLLESGAMSWDQFRIQFLKINTQYWNDRIKEGYHIYQVLAYSFRDTLLHFGLDDSLADSLAHRYWDTFCNICHFEDHAQELLALLHGKYRIAAISNGIGVAQRGRLGAGGVDHYFESLIISDEVGFWKPDKEIFDEALGRLNLTRREALFVGDSLNDDYRGAMNAGIDFCFYNRKGTAIDERVLPTYSINHLNQIMTIL